MIIKNYSTQNSPNLRSQIYLRGGDISQLLAKKTALWYNFSLNLLSSLTLR